MKYLFSKEGRDELRSFLQGPTLFAFDFDGTLVAIADSRHQVSLSVQTKKLLKSLAEAHPVGIISGRGVGDLKRRVKLDLDYYIGNHGLEGVHVSAKLLQNAFQICKVWLGLLESAGVSGLAGNRKRFWNGVEVENKGYTLSLHFRMSTNRSRMKQRLLNLISEFHPLPRIVLGKAVINLTPYGVPHKGTALLDLMKRTRAPNSLYVGDDVTDEDVFSLVSAGQSGNKLTNDIFSIRVGFNKASQARYYLKSQVEIDRLLQALMN